MAVAPGRGVRLRQRPPAPTPDGGRGTTTGRRLFAAFSLLVCAYALALVFLLARLREMEPALEGIRQLEGKARVLLALEAAVREEFAHDLLADAGEPTRAHYESIRRHVTELQRNIA